LALLQLGEHGRADADRQVLRDAYPDFSAACRDLGMIYVRQGDQALAHRLFEAAVHFQPSRANDIAWSLVSGPSRVRDPAVALPLAQKAVERDRQNAAYRNTLGVVHYRLGNYREAIACLTECVAAKHAMVGYDLYFLAMAHQRLGDAGQAHQYFDQAEAWWQANQNLPAAERAELGSFRAEAAALLESGSK
jgi:tetratricopeptide (TPR) repeat protein